MIASWNIVIRDDHHRGRPVEAFGMFGTPFSGSAWISGRVESKLASGINVLFSFKDINGLLLGESLFDLRQMKERSRCRVGFENRI